MQREVEMPNEKAAQVIRFLFSFSTALAFLFWVCISIFYDVVAQREASFFFLFFGFFIRGSLK